jgi:hypothetical protein
MYKNLKYLFISSLVFAACSEDIKETDNVEEPLTAGSANFSKYVAVGNSLTAGFSDGALFIKGQENAYPNMMAKEFAKVGGGAFKTPFMADNLGGFQSGGAQVSALPTRLFFNGSGPQNVPGLSATVLGQSIAAAGPYQNLGIPGAKSFHLAFNGYGALNPYYGRIATSASANVAQDAVAQNPTFFSLWIGNNDVLSFATSGGVGINQLGNTNPATYGNNDITDPTAFAGVYNQLINAMTANGAKGIVANIPSVTAVPYFTTVPHNPVPLDAANAGALNAGLIGPLDAILTALGQPDRLRPLTVAANNPLLIVDEGLTNLGAQIAAAATASGNPQLMALAPFLGGFYGQARHANPTDLVCLPTRGVIGQPAGSPVPSLNAFGVSFPLQDQHVLVPVEQAMVATATAAFNVSIKAAADSKGLAFLDANAIMNQISTTGVIHQGFRFTGAYVFGNSFSLDGVHLSPRANGFVANLMLEAINAKYGSNFKPIRITNLPALYALNL